MQLWIVNSQMKQQLADNIRQHKKLYIFNGVMFFVLGVIFLAIPLVAAEILDFIIGGLLLLTGLGQLTISYLSKRHWTYYLTTILYLVAGLLLLFRPHEGVLALAAIVGVFFLLQGCMQLFTAALYAPFPGWVWVSISGLVSLLLASLVYVGWPITGMWLLGIMLGINFLAFGISTMMLTRYV